MITEDTVKLILQHAAEASKKSTTAWQYNEREFKIFAQLIAGECHRIVKESYSRFQDCKHSSGRKAVDKAALAIQQKFDTNNIQN